MIKKTKQKNIPAGWIEAPVDKIFHFVRTYAVSRENLINGTLSDEGIRNIHYGDLHSTYDKPSINLRECSVPLVKDKNFSPRAEDLLIDGDLIMADVSEDYAGVGVTISIHGLNGKKVVGGLHTFVLRDTHNKTIERYRQYLFGNPNVRNKLKKIANGISVYGISKTAISKLSLMLPPASEQKRIASILETWDSSLERLKQKIEIKKQIKDGLMQQLLTGKRRLKGFTEPWKITKLGSLFKERKESKTFHLPLLSITADQGVIQQSSSNKKDTSNIDKSKYKRICPGDIGYNTMRMWQGRSALSNLEGIISPAYTVITPQKNTCSKYFSYLFKTPRLAYLFFQKSQGLVSDTWNCKFKNFALVKYSIPSFDEQVAIADILNNADDEIRALEQKKNILKDQKIFLLNNLVTGRIRTPESMKV